MSDLVQYSPKPAILFESKKKLTPGQEQLMKLISFKIRINEKIVKTDITPIYVKHVQRSNSYGYWAYADGYVEHGEGNNFTRRRKEKWETVPYEKCWIEEQAINWLIRSLGALIKKGYLTVIPVMDLASVSSIQKEVE